MAVVGLAGCRAPGRASVFEITDYRKDGEARQYREEFPEAFYHIDRAGNVEVVLRREQQSATDPDKSITQVIHIRSVWRSVPGLTVAHETQINATVDYLIVGGAGGATFEGAGSVFFDENRDGNKLEGELELALLRPTRRLSNGDSIFHRAKIRGEFFARRDRRKLVRTLNEMNRLFGPLPPFATRVPPTE